MKKIVCLISCIVLVFCLCSCATPDDHVSSLDKYEEMLANSPKVTNITVWTYYNATQKTQFDAAVENFNNTVGKDKKIYVTAAHSSDVSGLKTELDKSMQGDVNAKPTPNLFTVYADDCMDLDAKYGKIATLDKYFLQSELDGVVDGLLNEGRYDGTNLKIVPTAKSTELFMMNKTAWDAFAAIDKTVSLSDLETIEGITAVAEKYYNYSNGKAFFGRDAMANYVYTGARSLGNELFSVSNGKAKINYTKETMKKLYDNFFVPYVKGHFFANENSDKTFRTDDIKNGNIIACICSTAGGTTNFPTRINVAGSDTQTEPIDVYTAPVPKFKDGTAVAISQGAGMAIKKSSEKEEYASVVFLKWFNQKEQSVPFSANTGYVPSLKNALNSDLIISNILDKNIVLKQSMANIIGTTTSHTMYFSQPFTNSYKARSFLSNCIQNNDRDDDFINAVDAKKLITQAVQDGMGQDAAYKQFVTDYFETWYANITTKLTGIIG